MESTKTVEDGKTMAIVTYITIIGLIVAFIVNSNKKNPFTAYHIRQSLGIYITWLVLNLVISAISFIVYIPLLSWLVYLAMITLLVLGIVTAIQSETKPTPILGEKFQEWFKNIG